MAEVKDAPTDHRTKKILILTQQVEALIAERDEARTVAKQLKTSLDARGTAVIDGVDTDALITDRDEQKRRADDLEAALQTALNSLKSYEDAAQAERVKEEYEPKQKLLMMPLTWKITPGPENENGVPGMVTFGFDISPGKFLYREEMSFAEQSGWVAASILSQVKSAAERAVDPTAVVNGKRINVLGVVNGQPTVLGKFSRGAKLIVTVEIHVPQGGGQ